MQSTPQLVAPSRFQATWPLAAMCFLGIAGLLIAGTIILALIPIYIAGKGVTPNPAANDAKSFYVEYEAPTDINSSATGSIQNPNDIAKALALDDEIDILSGLSQGTFDRRKRVTSERVKRRLKNRILVRCQPKKVLSCLTTNCINSFREKIMLKVKNAGNIANIQLKILSGGVLKSVTLNLIFIGTVIIRPVGFGEVSAFEFVAVKSGPFNDPTTWAGGIVPYGDFTIVIPVGIIVTLKHPRFQLKMKRCKIYGQLLVGEGYDTFQYDFPPSFIIYSGGKFADKTTKKKILIPVGGSLLLLPGGSMENSGTLFQVYSIVNGSLRNGDNVTIPASGPFTINILSNGTLISDPRIFFIASQSGSFSSDSTYLCGLAPSKDICTNTSPCKVEILPNIFVTTGELNGEVDMNIDEIVVASGAQLQLGTSGLSKGFKFRYPIRLNNYGILSLIGGSTILIPPGSLLKFFAGSTFTSLLSAIIQVFNPISGALIGSGTLLGFSFRGPKFFIIGLSGNIIITIIDPDIITTTTPMMFTSAVIG